MELSKQNLELFEATAKEYFAHRRADAKDVGPLIDSMEYSFFNGGKRFRPMLCYAVGEALGLEPKKVTGFAMALEAIHTYSLIHDDLPCMDDDSERRGQSTNHIKFSEDVALLAGDALLTEAFLMLTHFYPEQATPLVSMLSEGSGLNGMIRGQILDLGKGDSVESLSDLINLHELKTGRLISLSFMGPAQLAGRDPNHFRELGLKLGLAFQVKDDILDQEEDDEASFINFLGLEGTQSHLQSLTEKISQSLVELEVNTPQLSQLVEFNFNRNQ